MDTGNTTLSNKTDHDLKLGEDVILALLTTHQQQLAQIHTKLREVIQVQENISTQITAENNAFKEIKGTFDLTELFNNIALYTQKLVRLKLDMAQVNERVYRLKRRSMVLQQHRQIKTRKEAELAAREQLLVAKPVWKNDDSPS